MDICYYCDAELDKPFWREIHGGGMVPLCTTHYYREYFQVDVLRSQLAAAEANAERALAAIEDVRKAWQEDVDLCQTLRSQLKDAEEEIKRYQWALSVVAEYSLTLEDAKEVADVALGRR